MLPNIRVNGIIRGIHLKDTNAYIQSTTSWIIATRLHVFSFESFEQKDTSKGEGKGRRERERGKNEFGFIFN